MTMNKEELYEIASEMEHKLGTDEFLKALLMAMESRELQENLEYINRVNDLNIAELEGK